MARGRGGAGRAMAIVLALLFFMLLQTELVVSEVYTVGDDSGWTFGAINWLNGKKFQAGDVLIFKYDPSVHNVAKVDFDGYKHCRAPTDAQILSSGNDQITLSKGINRFICNISDHCFSGMKLVINAN